MNDANTMDTIFQALAHQSRREMLDHVRLSPGMKVGDLASVFDVSRIAVMKHLAVLEEANLIVSQKDGRTRRLYFNAVPIQMIYDRWSDEYSSYWSNKVTSLKYAAERKSKERGNE